MPIKQAPARIPIIFQDYKNINSGISRELFLDYENHDIYYIDPTTKKPVSISKEIKDMVELNNINAAKIHIVPLGQTPPPIKDREVNNWYLIVEKEKEKV